MENENKKAKSAETAKKVKSMPITGQVTLEESNGNSYVVMTMDNPISGEDLDDLKLTFVNPNKKNSFGMADDRVGEKRKGLFEYFAKKALAGEVTSVPFSGDVTYKRIRVKRDLIDYISIDINSPFPEMLKDEEEKQLHVYLRKAETQGLFEFFAKERLELVLVENKK